MESGQFDRLTKTFARQESRRAAMKAVAGATLGAVMLPRGDAAAAGEVTIAHRACKERTRRCRRKSQCCGGKAACRQTQDANCPLTGRRCCGTEGAKCRNVDNGCDCCAGLFCNGETLRCTLG